MKSMRKSVLIATAVLLILAILAGCEVILPREDSNVQDNTDNDIVVEEQLSEENLPEEAPEVVEEPKKIGKKTITISAVGDIMVHDNELKGAYDEESDTYDFVPFFQEIKPQLEKADLTIGNLETTISGKDKAFRGYPMFNSPESLLTALKGAGFDVLTTANNHSLDRKMYGVLKTIENLDKEQIHHTGTYASPEEQEKILIEDVKGIRVAIMAYTYGTNGMEQYVPEEDLSYLVNYIDLDRIKKDIKKAKEENADLIVVALHWGTEYTREPSKSQKKLAEQVFEAGADIILGGHPHMVQPMERKTITTEDGIEKEVFIIYSMGNFISDQRAQYKDSGIIVNIDVEKDFDTGEVMLKDITYIPTWVHRYKVDGKFNYRIIPAGKYALGDEELEGLGSSAKKRVKEVWKETTTLIGEEAGKPLEE